MRQMRLADRSLHYYLENNLTSIWGSFLSVIDGYPYPEDDITLPTVSVDYLSGSLAGLEIGTDNTEDTMIFEIDIFARSKGERDDLSDIVEGLLVSGCDLLQFSGGGAGESLGYMAFERITSKPVYYVGGLPSTLANRAVVTARADVVTTGN